MAEKTKQTTEQLTKDLTDKLEAGMKELFTSDKYKDYLTSMSHFHNYSIRNVMLIHQQMPEATRVGSFKLWKDEFNRHVKKGETSLRIFAPMNFKSDVQKTNPETKVPLFDSKGKPIMEEYVKFKAVPVFDLSQTDGDPLPEIVHDLAGNVTDYENFLDTLKEVSPLPITFEPLAPTAGDGYCQFGEKIGIREDMSEIQTISTMIHEIAHAKIHDPTLNSDALAKTRQVKEIEAESIAYVVCQKYGIETGDNSFGYLVEWGNHDIKEVQASLEVIRKEASSLITDIDEKLAVILVEREADVNQLKEELNSFLEVYWEEEHMNVDDRLLMDKTTLPNWTNEDIKEVKTALEAVALRMDWVIMNENQYTETAFEDAKATLKGIDSLLNQIDEKFLSTSKVKEDKPNSLEQVAKTSLKDALKQAQEKSKAQPDKSVLDKGTQKKKDALEV